MKSQEARGAVAAAEGERLRRLRERVEAQESKLRRLRALRGQVDLQKSYNATLSEFEIVFIASANMTLIDERIFCERNLNFHIFQH